MFLKPRWHVPDQNLVKCTPWGKKHKNLENHKFESLALLQRAQTLANILDEMRKNVQFFQLM